MMLLVASFCTTTTLLAAPSPKAKVDIPRDGLRLWLAADGEIIKDKDGRVSVWRDQAGQLFDLHQKDNGNPSTPTFSTISMRTW
jgi:hypothetical protein